MRFRANSKFCAQVWDSGRVVVYDNLTNTVRGEYVPASHLQCTANCLRWEGDNLLILGGQDGTVIIFDALELKVKSFLKKVHAGPVEDLLVIGERVLSCGQDGALCEYHLLDQTRLQWDGASESRPLYSLAAIRDGSRLLAASISLLRVFDVASRTLLKTVTTQHVSPVRFLLPTDDSKILSCADRHLVVWSGKKLRCETALVVSASEVVALHCEGPRLVAVCSGGECVVWSRVAIKDGDSGDGNRVEQWSRKLTLQVATPAAEPLEVHEARVVGGDQLLLVYGPTARPRIEIVPVPSRNHVLIREVVSFSQQQKQKQASEEAVGVPVTQYKSTEAKIIGPLNERAEKTTKNIPKFEDRDEIPLEERLLDGGSDSGKGDELDDQPLANPRTDNMVHLLLQGLQSGDRTMLNAVISRDDPEVIDNTMKRLPIDAIHLLIKELETRLSGRPAFVAAALRWMRALFTHHCSYLESCPQLLQPILFVLQSRLTCVDRVVDVKSRLDSLLAARSYQTRVDAEAEITLVEEDDVIPLDSQDGPDSAAEGSSGDEEEPDPELMEVEV